MCHYYVWIYMFLPYPKIKHMQQMMENEIPERTDVEMTAASNAVDAEDLMHELLGTGGIRSERKWVQHVSMIFSAERPFLLQIITLTFKDQTPKKNICLNFKKGICYWPIKHRSLLLTISQEAHTVVRRSIASLQFLSFFEDPPSTNSSIVV